MCFQSVEPINIEGLCVKTGCQCKIHSALLMYYDILCHRCQIGFKSILFWIDMISFMELLGVSL